MKVEPSSPNEVYLTLAVVSTVLMIEMAAFGVSAQLGVASELVRRQHLDQCEVVAQMRRA